MKQGKTTDHERRGVRRCPFGNISETQQLGARFLSGCWVESEPLFSAGEKRGCFPKGYRLTPNKDLSTPNYIHSFSVYILYIHMFNPKVKDFLEKNKDVSMLGLYWSLYWRFMVMVYGAILIATIFFLGLTTLLK